jgi:UDP-GlcNAc:undecaprenyl-phosphate GlcNAc-1-phosphate transferase
MTASAIGALLALVTSLVLTGIMRRLATSLGIVDQPDGNRKLHRAPTPLLGGCAVFASWLIGIMFGLGVENLVAQGGLVGQCTQATFFFGPLFSDGITIPLVLAALVVVATGILDDCLSLRARWKLLGQLVAALVLIAWGVVVNEVVVAGCTVKLGWLSGAFTLLWVVGAMNAVNMLDGLDGMASLAGFVMATTLAFLAWLNQNLPLALIAMALAGSLGGFLAYNLPPARIFLGDAGSTLIGLVVGVTAIRGSSMFPGTVVLPIAVAAMVIPIFDGGAAVSRRWLAGLSVATADRRHFYHCLKDHGWNNWQILVVVAMLCGVGGVGAWLSAYLGNDAVAIASIVSVACALLSTNVVGQYECYLVIARLRLLCNAMAAWLRIRHPLLHPLCWRLRDCQSFEEGWEIVQEWGRKTGLCRIELQIDQGDDMYEASQSFESIIDLPLWRVVLPIRVGNNQVGELKLTGYDQQMSLLPQVLGMSIVAGALGELSDRTKVVPTLLLTQPESGTAAKQRGKCA